MMKKIQRWIEIKAPVEDCYRLWTDFEQFPKFMKNVLRVHRQPGEEEVWHWVVKGPLGRIFEWDAVVDLKYPDKVVSWHTVGDTPVATTGAINFHRIDDANTRLYVDMDYTAPGSELGEFTAQILKDPSRMVFSELKHFKHYVEGKKAQAAMFG